MFLTKKKVIFFFFLFFIWMRFILPNLIVTEKVSLPFSGLIHGKVKIAFLSDLHSFKNGEKEKKVIRILKKENPDIILLGGDIVDWQTRDFKRIASFWQEISHISPNQTFAVWGNHDHRNRKFNSLSGLLSQNGIRVLDNESVSLDLSAGHLVIVGVDDPHSQNDNLEKATEGLPKNEPFILLAHSPEIFRKTSGSNAQIVLTGHTHGCQVKIPILCDWIVPLRYDKKYKEGLFYHDGRYLYITRGVGESFLPIRFNSHPEVTILLLSED